MDQTQDECEMRLSIFFMNTTTLVFMWYEHYHVVLKSVMWLFCDIHAKWFGEPLHLKYHSRK